ncbi:hypothetical protein ACHAXA_000982 [Cyclostephanos tholiformis]|uniref:Uncharacterized protein n=1 Tax=Cyclostephanos tholiformis TaxID=382380 RepID=A0ABD3SE33_9STRA
MTVDDDTRVVSTPDESNPTKPTRKDLPACDYAELKRIEGGSGGGKGPVDAPMTAGSTRTRTRKEKEKKRRKKPMETEEGRDASSDGASTSKSADEISSASKGSTKSYPKASSTVAVSIDVGRDTRDAPTPVVESDQGRNEKYVAECESTERKGTEDAKIEMTARPLIESLTKKKTKRNKSTGVEKVPVASSDKVSISKSEDEPSTAKDPIASKEASAGLLQNLHKVDNSEGMADDKSPKVSKNRIKRLRWSTDAPRVEVADAKSAEETKNDIMESQTEAARPTRPETSKKKRGRKSTTVVKDASEGPTSKIPRKDSLKKNKSIKSSTKEGDISSSKKVRSLHETEQTHKHDRPPVSPSPNRTSNRKLPSHDKSVSPPRGSVKPKLIIDVNVHRLRFMKLHPKSILSMATMPLPHPVANSDHHHPRHPARLAISREGGSVELISPQDRWVSVGNIPGVRGREVDAMVWIYGNREREDDNNNDVMGAQHSRRISLMDDKMRLFGCSRDGTIFELDFATRRQINVIGSGGGGVFCLATMCSRGTSRSVSFGGHFAAGCEDGTIKIYSVVDGIRGGNSSGIPTLAATLASSGSAILSLAWLPGQNEHNDEGMGGSVIFAGVADGTIRRFDCVTSLVTGPISTGSVIASSSGSAAINHRWKSTLRMTVENRGLRESTKVWALEALSDGTVISGDSLGHVQIWDGMSGTMTQTFDHNESGADVLCLAVSEDENKIFASGVDSSVRCIQRQGSTASADGERKWISSNSHRKHSHDVKALAICHKETSHNSNPLELLVSGSVDTRICSYIVKDFKSIRPKIWYNWPTLSPISLSRKQRLLAVTRDNRIDLYFMYGPALANSAENMFPESRDESKSLVKTIIIQSPFNLSCSVISDDGRFLAASDAVSLYVFSLKVDDKDGIMDVRPTKIGLSGVCKHPATALKFWEGNLICATISGPINILDISSGFSDKGNVYTISLKHIFKEHMIDRCATSHHFPIVCLEVSSDGKWLAAGRFSSEKGSVHVFSLPTSDGIGLYQHWWAVPQMDASTTCIKFLGGGSVESSLAVACSNNEFYIYNLCRRSWSHWSNDMGVPLLKSLPKELTSRSEPVTRIVSHSVSPQRFILGSYGYFCVVDLDQPVPERSSMFPPDHLRAKRLHLVKEDDALLPCPPSRKQTHSDVSSNNFTICLRYNEILFQDFVAENEMVIVEEPWMSILEDLPDALARRVYGT